MANATLTRFFSLHFLLPFITLVLAGVHLVFLHEETSSNPLGITTKREKVTFHPYYVIKDVFGVFILLLGFFVIVLGFPLVLGDCENFIVANPLVTPVHIQPEWYFLFAYAILRAIPRKLGGVIALAMAIGIFYVLPFIPKSKIKGCNFYPVRQVGV